MVVQRTLWTPGRRSILLASSRELLLHNAVDALRMLQVAWVAREHDRRIPAYVYSNSYSYWYLFSKFLLIYGKL